MSLKSTKVLDISRILAGPMAGMLLGDLGCDVLKVERPDAGDDTRDWGLSLGNQFTTYYNSVNRNKRCITLDLQTAKGASIAKRLALQSDVLIENFKAGGADKLGLGYEELSRENKRLIYCSISGYDRHSDERDRPGYDLVIQGESGMMAINGEAGRPPLKFGIAAADMMTGMYAAQAILAALYDRESTGVGAHIELSLFECGVTIPSYVALEALHTGQDPQRYGNNHPSIVPYGVFDAADGPIVIAVGNNRQFADFCIGVIERPELASDVRFKTNLSRVQHRDTLAPILESEIRKHDRRTMLAKLKAMKIPAGEVNSLTGALQSERVSNGTLIAELGDEGRAKVLAPPFRFDGIKSAVRMGPPKLGEHTVEILKSRLDLGDDEISLLRHEKIL